MKIFAVGLVVGMAWVGVAGEVRAQTFPPTVIRGDGYTLKTRAYIDPSRLPDSKNNPALRADFQLWTAANAPYRWDFVLPELPHSAGTFVSGAAGVPDSKNRQKTTLRATLRQFDSYEEKVTFKNLDLLPVARGQKGQLRGGPRFLALARARSLTTPSGITVTLPAQSGLRAEDMNAVYNGNVSALWVRIGVEPRTRLSQLPASPLFRKHGRAVSLALQVPPPNFMVYAEADNTFSGLKIGFPHLDSMTHLDELTLIVRQRVDLKTVPVAIEVPISKPARGKAVARKP